VSSRVAQQCSMECGTCKIAWFFPTAVTLCESLVHATCWHHSMMAVLLLDQLEKQQWHQQLVGKA
jgi:hypothetical protein